MCHGNSENSDGCSYIFSGFALFTELMWVCRGVESLCKLLTAKKVPFDTKKRVQIKILSILKLVSFKSLTEKIKGGDRPPPPLIRHCLNPNCEVLDEKYRNSLFKEFW